MTRIGNDSLRKELCYFYVQSALILAIVIKFEAVACAIVAVYSTLRSILRSRLLHGPNGVNSQNSCLHGRLKDYLLCTTKLILQRSTRVSLSISAGTSCIAAFVLDNLSQQAGLSYHSDTSRRQMQVISKYDISTSVQQEAPLQLANWMDTGSNTNNILNFGPYQYVVTIPKGGSIKLLFSSKTDRSADQLALMDTEQLECEELL
jgi:hypothetical protein